MTRTRTRLAAAGAVTTTLVATAAGAVAAAPADTTAAAARADRPGVTRSNEWVLRNALSGGPATTTFRFGATDPAERLTGDWDGNGTRTPAVVRAVGGTWVWALRNSNSAGPVSTPQFAYGTPASDVPVVGDWDGDGRDSVGVVRRTAGATSARWLLRDTAGPGAPTHDFRFGRVDADRYVTGDWDGDGTDTPGEVVQVGGRVLRWFLRDANSAGSSRPPFDYGDRVDVPVVGDWDGDGQDGIGVVHDDGGAWVWKLRQFPAPGSADVSFRYGPSSAYPVVWS